MPATARRTAVASYDVAVGDTVSIVLASGLHSASAALSLAYASAMCEVVEVTAKAVKLAAETSTGKTVSAWFPRKALPRMGDAHQLPGTNNHMHTTDLARWFKADGWTARFLELTTQSHVLSTR